MVTLYQLSIWAALVGVILLICYALIKFIVRNELRKSIPNQVKAAQDLFNGKNVRLTLKINANGETELEHWDLIRGAEYIG